VCEERCERRGGKREQAEGLPRGPACRGSLDDGVGERGEQDDHKCLAHRIQVSANSPSPVSKTRRRPRRSAIDPDSISRLARTSVYASTVHCSPVTVVCSSRPIDGRATFTIVLSSPTISRLMQQIARTRRRRARVSSELSAEAGGDGAIHSVCPLVEVPNPMRAPGAARLSVRAPARRQASLRGSGFYRGIARLSTDGPTPKPRQAKGESKKTLMTGGTTMR